MDFQQIVHGVADPTRIVDEAMILYHNNAEFHARVERSVQIIESKAGKRFEPEDRDIAILSASVSLYTTILD